MVRIDPNLVNELKHCQYKYCVFCMCVYLKAS